MAAAADPADDGQAPAMLRAESLRLRGIAYLLGEQPKPAAEALVRALELASGDDNMAAEIQILLAEAFRRAGQAADSVAAWAGAARMTDRIHDPVLGERILALKPAETAWPAPVRDAADLWMRVGRWHLARRAPSKALVAFTNAQNEAAEPSAQKQARIAQATALVQLKQMGAALSILAGLVDDADKAVAGHALAVMGVIRIEQGQTAQGLELTRKAIEESADARWPERSQALADLGLAYLVAGQADKGLQALHEAQAQFLKERKSDDLAQSLLNEAAFTEKTGDKAAADSLRRRAMACLQERP
jgi:tetratricopeptide (TPR) repeat protein